MRLQKYEGRLSGGLGVDPCEGGKHGVMEDQPPDGMPLSV